MAELSSDLKEIDEDTGIQPDSPVYDTTQDTHDSGNEEEEDDQSLAESVPLDMDMYYESKQRPPDLSVHSIVQCRRAKNVGTILKTMTRATGERTTRLHRIIVSNAPLDTDTATEYLQYLRAYTEANPQLARSVILFDGAFFDDRARLEATESISEVEAAVASSTHTEPGDVMQWNPRDHLLFLAQTDRQHWEAVEFVNTDDVYTAVVYDFGFHETQRHLIDLDQVRQLSRVLQRVNPRLETPSVLKTVPLDPPHVPGSSTGFMSLLNIVIATLRHGKQVTNWSEYHEYSAGMRAHVVYSCLKGEIAFPYTVVSG